MKNLLKFTLVLALVYTSAGAHASTADFSLLVKKEQGKATRTALNSLEKTILNLSDNREGVIYAKNPIVGNGAVSSEYYKPVLVYKGGMVTLSILNFRSSPIDIIIYDAENNEVYSGTFEGKESFFKKFDISKVASSHFTFEIGFNNKSFVETIATK